MRKKIIIGLIILLTLSGCWGHRELNELSLVAGIAIDESEIGYLVSLQVMVPREIASEVTSGTTKVKLFSDEGKSLFHTIRKLTKTLPRKGYFTHLMAVIIDEKVFSESIIELVDFLLRDPEIRPDVPIFIAKNSSAKDVLKILTHIENIPANKINKTSINLKDNFMGYRDITFMDLITKIGSKGVNPAIMGITLEGDITEGDKITNTSEIEAKAEIHLTQFAVTKNNILVGWLSENESIGYSYLLGEIDSTIITIPCDINKTNSLEVTNFKNKINLQVVEGEPVINITHNIETNIGQLGCPIDLNNKNEVEKHTKLFAEEVIQKSENTLEILQKTYKSDIIGFGEIIRRKNPKLWKKFKDDWDSHFSNLKVNV